MNRRSAIKNLTILAGGVFLFPACTRHDDGRTSVKLSKMHIDADQEKTVQNLAETIIPQTDSPGAKALNVHLFVLTMMNDCHSKQDQQTFLSGLSQLNELSSKQYQHNFTACNPKQREETLMLIEKKQQIKPELLSAYQMAKKLTVEGYTISKYVMTTKLPYVLVPGHYNGYFPVKNLKSAVKNV